MTEIISTRQQLVNEINQSSTFKLDSEGNLKKAGFLDKVKNFFSSVFNATDYAIRKEAIENKIVDILSNDKEATDITDKNNSNNLKSLSSKLSGKYNNTKVNYIFSRILYFWYSLFKFLIVLMNDFGEIFSSLLG